MLCVQKSVQCRRFSHSRFSCGLETFQGATVDSLGVGTVKTGCIYAPDCRRCRQEAPKRYPATPAWFWQLLGLFLHQKGCWDPLCLFHTIPQGWEASKCKNHNHGSCTPARSGTSRAPTTLKLARESQWTPWGSAPLKSGA